MARADFEKEISKCSVLEKQPQVNFVKSGFCAIYLKHIRACHRIDTRKTKNIRSLFLIFYLRDVSFIASDFNLYGGRQQQPLSGESFAMASARTLRSTGCRTAPAYVECGGESPPRSSARTGRAEHTALCRRDAVWMTGASGSYPDAPIIMGEPGSGCPDRGRFPGAAIVSVYVIPECGTPEDGPARRRHVRTCRAAPPALSKRYRPVGTRDRDAQGVREYPVLPLRDRAARRTRFRPDPRGPSAPR